MVQTLPTQVRWVRLLAVRLTHYGLLGSPQESDEVCILCGLLKNNELGFGKSQSLCFEQQIVDVAMAATVAQQCSNISGWVWVGVVGSGFIHAKLGHHLVLAGFAARSPPTARPPHGLPRHTTDVGSSLGLTQRPALPAQR